MENTIGPSFQNSDENKSSSMKEYSLQDNCPPGAEERLINVEKHLNINKSSANVFSRLKAVEDRILYLESISPEYFYFEVSSFV